MNWSEPKDFREWARRTFTFRPLIVVLLALGICVSELRFDWMETVIGAYLTTTNSLRPESGNIWEVDHQTVTARTALEQIITDRQSVQNDIRGAESLSQILAQIPKDQGIMISTDHFCRLYFNLPQIIAEEIVSPFSLLKIAAQGDWDRVYFDTTGDLLNIYMLNRSNQVLYQLEVVPDLIYHIERGEVAFDGTLENLADFTGRIYDARLFFETVELLEPEVKNGIIAQPAGLLEISGRIARVGISDEVKTGGIELGFEFQTVDGSKVYFIRGNEWDVWRLKRHLEAAVSESGRRSDGKFTENLP
ncbi:MAG: hypothetical protein HKM93_20625 [Desulfobacteraceae bacterium]|nr:hypothetical protein [Desulfobacteraceae bacterium]